MVKINKVYTKTGDQGETGLIGGRIKKSSPRIRVLGEIDELNAALGIIRTKSESHPQAKVYLPLIENFQQNLFNLGAEVATIDSNRLITHKKITLASVAALEKTIDAVSENHPELRSFVLPGGDELNSWFHMARAICRRAEVSLWQLKDQGESLPEFTAEFLNRLSDLLFVLARDAALKNNKPEYLWDNK